MRYLLLALPLVLTPLPALAGGTGCNDVCTLTAGMTCLDRGMGCDPSIHQCAPCRADLHCSPGGTCNVATGMCMGVSCGGGTDAGFPDTGNPIDAGADAGGGDATPDAGDDMGTADTGTPDTGTPDTGTPDTGTPDMGTPDAGRSADVGPGTRIGGGGGPEKESMELEECGCTSAGHKRTTSLLWMVPLFGLLLGRRQRRCLRGISVPFGRRTTV